MQYESLVNKYINEELSYLSESTKNVRRSHLNSFGKFIDFKEGFAKNDIVAYINSENFKSHDVSYQNSQKLTLRRFFEWCRIPNLGNILKKSKEKYKELRKSDLLTKKEIRDILKKMRRSIDKALLIFGLETKMRVNEIRNLKIKDVYFMENHAIVYVKISKTAQRNIPIVESIPYLMRYLEDHPEPNNPDQYFFGHFLNGEFRQYSTSAFNKMLKRNTKFMGKNVYPHLLRHTGLTEMANHLTEFQLKKLAGWNMGSRQAARYVHLSSEDIESKILELHGLKLPEKPETTNHIELVNCPRCNYQNSDLDRFCSRCGSVLDIKTILDHQEIAKEMEGAFEKTSLKQYIEKLFEEKLKEIQTK